MANGNHKSLDINYSLKIGTSIYHVMGKRKGDRKGNYDYYVLDDKLVQTRAPKQRSSKTIKVHTRADEAGQTSMLDDKPDVQFDSTQLQEALAEQMRRERDEYLAELKAERKSMEETFERTAESLAQQRQELLDLIEENRRLAEENKKKPSTSDVIQKLTEEITKTHKLSADKVEELKQALTEAIETTVTEAQKKSTSLDDIEKTVINAMTSEKVTNHQIEELKKTVEKTIKEEVEKQKSVKIANHIDADAKDSEETIQPQTTEEKKTYKKEEARIQKVPQAAD